jgi:extracellular elastinolytic metalloproteinase
MAREVDVRRVTAGGLAPERERELVRQAEHVSAALPGEHEVRVERLDAVTGNPAVISSVGAPAEQGRFVERALEHVQTIDRAFGLAAATTPELRADPEVQRTSDGARVVSLQQLYKGLPIYDGTRTVVFGPTGAIEATLGAPFGVTEAERATPTLSAAEAVLAAARHVARPEDQDAGVDQFGQPLGGPGIELGDWEPRVVAAFGDEPTRPTVFEPGPFADAITASLIWFAVEGRLRLAWEVQLALPEEAGRYRTLVDAETGEILLSVQQIATMAARGNVYRFDPGKEPRRVTELPVSIADYGVAGRVPADPWVEGDSTVGNSVAVQIDETGRTFRAAAAGGTVSFDPPAESDEQKLLNLFFFDALLHDVFYALGFTEREGNFQRDNFGRGGAGNDRVDARVYPEPVWGTANMSTPAEGTSPVMKMGLVRSTGRHTAVDSSVVFHEYTHGVTNRLVGGRTNTRSLEAQQSRGMGEGWSDYVACTLNASTVVGAWVVDRAGGIRSHPYDDDYPRTFADIAGFTDEHDVGEVWAATLLALNRQLGVQLVLQLVVDALKLTPANPSFLDARDAIFLALRNAKTAGRLDEQQHADAYAGAWRVFARFGMGPAARTTGAFLSGIVADFNLPADVPAAPAPKPSPPEPTPEPVPEGTVEVASHVLVPIPDGDPNGVGQRLHVDAAGQIKRLEVAVDIEHTYVGDLRIVLFAPGGRRVLLRDRQGAAGQNLVQTYSSDKHAGLRALAGMPAAGDWTLWIADLTRDDVGSLRRWSLRLQLA